MSGQPEPKLEPEPELELERTQSAAERAMRLCAETNRLESEREEQKIEMELEQTVA